MSGAVSVDQSAVYRAGPHPYVDKRSLIGPCFAAMLAGPNAREKT
jgi:hypothetical protein